MGQSTRKSSFLNDVAIHDGTDLLQYSSLAEDFANKIYDNRSANSMIWGVEGRKCQVFLGNSFDCQ